jgi:hypothetical protein
VRGINSQHKVTAIKSKILESSCDIICHQETKKEAFDISFIKNLCPASFDHFEYVPSHGASRGTITIWKGCRFSGQLIAQNEFAMSMEFVCFLWCHMGPYKYLCTMY